MDVTDIPAVKSSREQREDSCLHCVLMTAIEQWFEDHGARADGKVVVDVTLAVSNLAECTVEFTEAPGDRSARRRAFRFAHDALDAQLKSVRTGRMIAVDISAEH